MTGAKRVLVRKEVKEEKWKTQTRPGRWDSIN